MLGEQEIATYVCILLERERERTNREKDVRRNSCTFLQGSLMTYLLNNFYCISKNVFAATQCHDFILQTLYEILRFLSKFRYLNVNNKIKNKATTEILCNSINSFSCRNWVTML